MRNSMYKKHTQQSEPLLFLDKPFAEESPSLRLILSAHSAGDKQKSEVKIYIWSSPSPRLNFMFSDISAVI